MEKEKTLRKVCLTLILFFLITVSVIPIGPVFAAPRDQLQNWFDANGYLIDVWTDETGIEVFPMGAYEITILCEVAAYKDSNSVGWYEVGNSTLHEVLLGPDGVGVAKQFTSTGTFGLYIDSPDGVFFTENSLQPDGFDHCLVYFNPNVSSGYIISLEDLWAGGDQSYNNMVVGLVPLDLYPPEITIISPENTTYGTSSIPLTFYINESTSWIGYSLDGAENVTITGNTTLNGLSDGPHNVIVFANDTIGFMGVSDQIFFTVDTTPPIITITSPANTTYLNDIIDLIFTANEPLDWIGYSLDGQENQTIPGNITLPELIDGSHTIVVFANDTVGNMGASEVVFFTVLSGDVAVIDLFPASDYVYENRTLDVTVVVENQGNRSETFNVLVYHGSTLIWNQTVLDLSMGANYTIEFIWNTTGFSPCQNLTLHAEASIVPFEEDIADNSLTDGYVKIRMLGDINGDGYIGIDDLIFAASSFGSYPDNPQWNPNIQNGHPRWNPDCDINNDEYVGIDDFCKIAARFGQSCP